MKRINETRNKKQQKSSTTTHQQGNNETRIMTTPIKQLKQKLTMKQEQH